LVVGADSRTNRKGTVEARDDTKELCQFFDKFDIIGTRIWPQAGYADSRFCWVPCASAMHPMIAELATTKPVERIGIYEHLRVQIPPDVGGKSPVLGIKKLRFAGHPTLTNRGLDIESKLRFLAKYEYVVTNSYHGVYWATLLGRKVICHPFKNGLYSFRFSPTYTTGKSLEQLLDEAQVYPDALDICRQANLGFYRQLLDLYADI
jgi:hypothetical protein